MDCKKDTSQEGLFLKGQHINLTALSEEDIHNSNWFDWFNDDESTAGTTHHRFPNTREDQKEYFIDGINGNRNRLQLGIRDLKGGPIVGVISLQQIDYIDCKAEIAVMIGEKGYRKIKFSIEAHKLIIAHGFNQLNLNRIYGGTFMKEWAEMLCRILGFQMEGLLRADVFKNGEYCDVYRFGLLRDDFYK